MYDEVRDHKAFCCQYHPSVIKLLVGNNFHIERILDEYVEVTTTVLTVTNTQGQIMAQFRFICERKAYD
jgi:hypothetical protein